MINTKNYILLDLIGYPNRIIAYEQIRSCYSNMNGVTTYNDNGLWYIVQSKDLK